MSMMLPISEGTFSDEAASRARFIEDPRGRRIWLDLYSSLSTYGVGLMAYDREFYVSPLQMYLPYHGCTLICDFSMSDEFAVIVQGTLPEKVIWLSSQDYRPYSEDLDSQIIRLCQEVKDRLKDRHEKLRVLLSA